MELYNLSYDPGEMYNIAHLYPEMVEKILEFAKIAREDVGDSKEGIEGKNVREPARY